MKKEIETLKEALHETKKVSKRHCKKLEESKVELNAALLAAQEKESELSIIKNKHKTAEEVLLTIESSIQCQICMDLPDRPFVLSPCGHVLCLSCLQEWFRKAPPTLDDMDIDPDELTDPHYILMRSKSCPSCRATVKSRPVPVFMVKAVSSALRKARPSSAGPGQASASNRPTTTDADNQDPWKGIFLSSEEDEDGDDSDLESESEDEDQQVLIGWYRQRELRRALFPDAESTDSEAEDDDDEDQDEDQDQGENASEDDDDVEQHLHILPRWAPPRMTGTQYTAAEQETSETLKLLQRGCSWEMLRNYDVAYRHNSGIILSLRSLNHLYASDDDSDDEEDCMNRVFLGWNISLDQDDVDGEAFITNILEDIKNNPIRWQVTRRRGVFLGAVDARRLVRADEVEEYDTTDTEVWIDAEEF
ncbi:hypothetical protein BDZ97DRAFT_850495 [Flammula alnicola]|nr:hypothetical protein BDZ97DRAFT_850495 [Flammula alnicola]